MNKSDITKSKGDKQWLRLAKLLSAQTRKGLPFNLSEACIRVDAKGRSHRFELSLFQQMMNCRQLEYFGENVRLTGAGLMELKNRLGLSFAESQCGAVTLSASKPGDGGPGRVLRNINESPLVRLYNRKLPNGSPYITQEQLRAGERLRQDFERGQLQPRITASWDAATGSPGKGARRFDANEISDFALDAREKVNRVVELLGPELSGVALDICCFLKGFESVERERQWPPRSAKLMLRTALAIMARHYGFGCGHSSTNRELQFWGSDDYRPSLG